jgi:hypothetical protein
MQTYTFGQCARLLDVDPKVFRRWVREDLGLQEEDQISRADGRVRYLTREQLERLAELHERTLPAADQHVGRDERSDTRDGAYKLLADRLDAAEHELREGTQRIERLAELTCQLEQFPAWMGEIEARLGRLEHPQEAFIGEQPAQRIGELEAQHRQEIAELEARYQQQIAELQAQLAAARKEVHPSTTGSVSAKALAKSKARPLPKALASRSAFAELHHVPDSVVARACNSGKIAATSGKWLYKSRIIFQALGERGQQDFYRVFHTRPDFTPCKRCPHEIKEE